MRRLTLLGGVSMYSTDPLVLVALKMLPQLIKSCDAWSSQVEFGGPNTWSFTWPPSRSVIDWKKKPVLVKPR